MLAFLQNLNPVELLVVVVVAVLIFGRRLPEVAGQAAGRLQRLRRTFNDLKRDSGLDDELREARRVWREAADDELRARPGGGTPQIGPPPAGRLARPDPAAPPAPAEGEGEGEGVGGREEAEAAEAPGPESRVEPARPQAPGRSRADGADAESESEPSDDAPPRP